MSKDGCPIDHSSLKKKRNVGANHESPSNQWPALGQTIELNTHRMPSSIPRVVSETENNKTCPHSTKEGEENWVYPSEQMFFNALKRKGYSVSEKDMKAVVAIHNTVNERTWQEILKWEEKRGEDVTKIRLAHFRGRPKDLSPKARFRNWIGYTLPFDRHDWTVDRGEGKRARYVIDYYNGKPLPGMPGPSVYIDARPALDSPSAVLDRLRAFASRNLSRIFS
jgi:cytochrome c heme-lyase